MDLKRNFDEQLGAIEVQRRGRQEGWIDPNQRLDLRIDQGSLPEFLYIIINSNRVAVRIKFLYLVTAVKDINIVKVIDSKINDVTLHYFKLAKDGIALRPSADPKHQKKKYEYCFLHFLISYPLLLIPYYFIILPFIRS